MKPIPLEIYAVKSNLPNYLHLKGIPRLILHKLSFLEPSMPKYEHSKTGFLGSSKSATVVKILLQGKNAILQIMQSSTPKL